MREYITAPLFRLILICLFIAMLIGIFYYSVIIVYPFFIAYLLSTILEPLIVWLEEKIKLNRSISIILIISSFFLIVFVTIYFMLQRLLQELTFFLKQYESHMEKIHQLFVSIGQSTFVKQIEKFVQLTWNKQWDWESFIQIGIGKLSEVSSHLISSLLQLTSVFLSSFTYILTVSMIILLTTYFLLKDRSKLVRIYTTIFPLSFQRSVSTIFLFMKKSIVGIFKTNVTLAFISSFICLIGFLFLNIEHLLLITCIIFILELIPYVGLGVIFIPWILYHFFTHDYLFTIVLIGLYISVIITRQMIEPKFLAKNLGIHPLVTLLVLFGSYQFAGFLGFLLTPLILILLSSIYRANIFSHIATYIKEGVKQ